VAIVIASDHAGYALKETLKARLRERGLEVQDLGTHGPEDADYPVYGERAARRVAAGDAERGVLVCGTGAGISMAANKVKGARCVCCSEPCTAALARRHNDANLLALGARVVGEELAWAIAETFLRTEFDGGERHARRVEMLNAL
jgi:ribose 5-phosphate isomerase B